MKNSQKASLIYISIVDLLMILWITYLIKIIY